MSKNYIGDALEPCGSVWCRGGTVMVSDHNGGYTWDICTSCEYLHKKAEAEAKAAQGQMPIPHPDYPF